MKTIKLMMATAVMLFSGMFSASAQQKIEWKEAKSGAFTYKYVSNDPSHARYYVLKNGLTVILSPSKAKPRVQCYIAIKAGSKTDPSDHTGLAHYLEHLLFKGTQKYGSLDWAKEKPYLDKIEALYEKYNHTTDTTQRKTIYAEIDKVSGEAAKYAIANEYDKMMSSMGAEKTNAFTSFEQTVYTDDIPANNINKYLAVQAERFRDPVFRIFHTELEAVYEEKNRGLDNDSRKVFESMFASMFPNNNYGKQTTIGTIQDLKNPSLTAIRKYFDTYYVPNNMGIIMAGDFNPDEVIVKIAQDFAYMQPKAIPAYTFEPEKPISAAITKEVMGPNPENIMLGYRFPGASNKDAQLLSLVGDILTNGSAGLIDLDLVKKQKLLQAFAFPYVLKDYSVLLLQGNPKQGQNLDEVKALLTTEINKLKTGDFSEDLIPSIVNNKKKQLLQQTESYGDIASALMDNFTTGTDWKDQVENINYISSLSKKDIVAFANKYFTDDNYVAVYKRKGVDNSIVKVEKPHITPVTVNREAQSPFLKMVNNMPENAIKPQWLDYTKDIQRGKLGDVEVLAVSNKTNALFSLSYYFEAGKWSNKWLPYAADYLSYLGTKDKSAEQFSKEFYKLASSFDVQSGNEQTSISLSGLNENLTPSVQLLEDLMHNCVADTAAFKDFIAGIKKGRADAKANKARIMAGLRSYAQYGAKNPFNNQLTDEELNQVTAADLVAILHDLVNYKHKVIYYGPQTVAQITATLKPLHTLPATLKDFPQSEKYSYASTDQNSVLFAKYDMVQAEIIWQRNEGKFDAAEAPVISLFNNYFGGGMSSLVFQTIRESKALAYSTYAFFNQANKLSDQNTAIAYVGTQADKFNEAVIGMNELLNVLPESQKALETAKTSLIKSLASERITQSGIIFNYLSAKKLGLNEDIRKSIFEKAPKLTLSDIKAFHNKELSNKPYSYCIVSGENRIKPEDLSKLGAVKVLNLEQIFGY